MDSYIIRIYRRDINDHPLTGTVEPVGINQNTSKKRTFNDKEKLWALLSCIKASELDSDNN